METARFRSLWEQGLVKAEVGGNGALLVLNVCLFQVTAHMDQGSAFRVSPPLLGWGVAVLASLGNPKNQPGRNTSRSRVPESASALGWAFDFRLVAKA